MTIARLTPSEIATGRASAKAEYDAAMAFYDAAERWNRLASGETAQTQVVLPSTLPYTFTDVSVQPPSIKQAVILILAQADEPMQASAIAARLRDSSVVNMNWPTTNIYPKLSGYGKKGLIVQADGGGWTITPSGRAFAREAQKNKGVEL